MNKSGAPLIKIEKMSVIFNQGKPNEARVFDNIDLDIYPHEYLILFGPSGCGKSTLLSVISGLLPPTSGKVLIDGKDMATFTEEEKLKYHRRQVGMIFQSFHLIPTLSIIDNVCLPRAFVGDDSPARERDGMNLLKRFEIDAHAEKFPNDVSGGQMQRAAIARALVNGPSIIVADEPVGNLDSKAAYNVFRILEELNEVDKKLIVLVTHDPSHLAYGDRVIYMQDGKITKTVEVLERRSPTMKTGRIYLEEQERIAGAWESFKSGMLGKAWELYKKGRLDKYWELVKKEELGKAWKAFKEGRIGEEWALGEEYELVKREELAEHRKAKEIERISPDLLALMRSFRDLTPEQIGTLLIPFKAQQIFSHIFFHLPRSRLDLAEKMIQDFVAGVITIESLERKLTEEESKGGAGWDRHHARQLMKGIRDIFDQVKKIDFGNIKKSAEDITGYFIEKFGLHLGEMERAKFLEYVKMRLANELSVDELLKIVDRPVVKGGVGLDHRTAVKMARELEIIMLARYSM